MLVRWPSAVAALLLLSCMKQATIRIDRTASLDNRTVAQPDAKTYSSVLVLPPSGVGNAPSAEAQQFSRLEAALMKRGIRVISVGVTGRVAVSHQTDEKNTTGG